MGRSFQFSLRTMFCLVVMTSTLLAIGVPGFALGADPPAVPDARKLVERSLPFLEKEAVAWVAEKKCVTCHHVPMMLWTHYEAKRRGFAVNENAAKELQGQALTQYLGHAELMPTAQDASFLEKPLGPGTVYLSLAIKAHPSPGGEVQKALHRLTANFVKHQNEDGSWTTKLNQPPMIDGHDVTTMLILLAMSTGPEGERRDVWERALTWLKSEPMREETQAMALRLLIAIRCGNRQEVQRLASLLRFKQREDGGWGQKPDLRSDALATGQALYALSAARTSADDPAMVLRARMFFASAQRDDGSWLVHARNARGHDPIISYVGTGWAVLGLLRSLDNDDPELTAHFTGNWLLHDVDGPADAWKGMSDRDRKRAFEQLDILIDGDRLTIAAEEETGSASLKLDPTSQPKAIDVKLDGEITPALGIYEFEGDALKVCFGTVKSQRPREMRAIPGEQSLFVLRRQTAEVQGPIPDDRKARPYVGINSVRPRQIAVVNGRFTQSTRLSASLYLVRGGMVDKVNDLNVGRSSYPIGPPFRERMKILVAVEDTDTPQGRVTSVGVSGALEGRALGGVMPHQFKAVETKVFPGQVQSRRPYILYVEGDRKIDAAPAMSLAEFAARNPGSYVVVTVELH